MTGLEKVPSNHPVDFFCRVKVTFSAYTCLTGMAQAHHNDFNTKSKPWQACNCPGQDKNWSCLSKGQAEIKIFLKP